MFFYFYHSEIFAALYEWLLHYAVNNFCFAFAASMFHAGALVVLANCAFNHFAPPLLAPRLKIALLFHKVRPTSLYVLVDVPGQTQPHYLQTPQTF